MNVNSISGVIVDTAVHIHKELGPGLLESVYEIVMARELAKGGFTVERQKAVSFFYRGIEFEEGFRVDLLVQNAVVVEIKSVRALAPVHSKQLLTYLKLLNVKLGLLLNFGAPYMKDGIVRVVNRL